ncbi:hypothetical protein EB118_15680, partial [bacterium]|nr:hypothetical protein [bacterium]
MNKEEMITWSDDDVNSKANALSKFSDNISEYVGLPKTQGTHYRNFIDIESNRTVKPGFNPSDYYAFRPDEAVPQQQRRAIKMCMDAYDKVGIIRNIIDLMGDFGSQGIEIVHQNSSVENFYKQWFKSVNGKERSERFLNNLYKAGNVIIYRSYANMTPELTTYMKSLSKDIRVDVPNIPDNQIPWRYNFFNPLTVKMTNGNLSLFMGAKDYTLSANTFLDKFPNGDIPSTVLDTLPPAIKQSLQRGDRDIPLDKARLSVFHYKKDDWLQWANPMIYAILDDIIMLEKMRLADLSALDGAISNIRLWTLGSLEHKILPNKAAINKLRDILASNVGGGTMELVWGPELTFKESNSEVYKFLGSEKYTAVLNSIYAGLGVPPTLTGMATNGGGFTNNFISLKTLVERLQYGRDLLIKFWEKEIEIVRKAMGFRYPAYIQFDQMTLSDEATEKNLLIQLADRDIISHETILERFKEIPEIEKIRLKREVSAREEGKISPKASPYHDPKHKQNLEKIALQNGKVTPQDVGLKTSVPKDVLIPKPQTAPSGPAAPISKPSNNNGRPPMSNDTGPRKQRIANPRSKPGIAELVVWSETSWEKLSNILTNAYLKSNNKKNLRQLTKAEVNTLEQLKIDVLTNLPILSDVDEQSIAQLLYQNIKTPIEFMKLLKNNNITIEDMTIDAYRRSILG